jgi:cellobiose phosphorylase
MTAGPDSPTPGEAKNAWLTGTAAWSFVAISQYILGIRPSPAGLIVDPCIPTTWTGFKAQRRFRGVRYDIEVRNPRHLSRGVSRMTVDGKPVTGNTIPIATGAASVKVVVELGA